MFILALRMADLLHGTGDTVMAVSSPAVSHCRQTDADVPDKPDVYFQFTSALRMLVTLLSVLPSLCKHLL